MIQLQIHDGEQLFMRLLSESKRTKKKNMVVPMFDLSFRQKRLLAEYINNLSLMKQFLIFGSENHAFFIAQALLNGYSVMLFGCVIIP